MPIIGIGVGLSYAQQIAPIRPGNLTVPVVTGTDQVGQTLTSSTGTWSGSTATYSYQWKSAGVNVGTNSSTYVVAVSDVGNTITCTVTATNSAGSASATSAATSAVVLLTQAGLLFQLKMNDGSGSSSTSLIPDTSGNGNNATLGYSGGNVAQFIASGVHYNGAAASQMPSSAWASVRTLMIFCDTPATLLTAECPIAGGSADTHGVVFRATSNQPFTGGDQLTTGTMSAQGFAGINGIAVVYGSPQKLYVNGVIPPMLRTDNFTPSGAGTNWTMGQIVGSGNAYQNLNIYFVAGWSNQNTQTQVQNDNAAIAALLSASVPSGGRGLTVGDSLNKSLPYIMFYGDSLTSGISDVPSAFGYPGDLMPNVTTSCNFVNLGTGGQTLQTMVANRAAIIDALVAIYASASSKICVLWGGTNDFISNASAATVYGYYQTIGAAMIAEGITVILIDCITRGDFTGAQQTAATAFNTSLAGDFTVAVGGTGTNVYKPSGAAVYGHYCVRASQDKTCANPNDLYWFVSDKVHRTGQGYTKIANLCQYAFSDMGTFTLRPNISVPAAYWPLAEASGATRNDKCASAQNLSNNGTVNQASGLITNSAQASSAASWLSNAAALGSKMLPGTKKWCIGAWVFIPSAYSSFTHFFTLGDLATVGFDLGVNSSLKIVLTNESSTVQTVSTAALNTNAWNLICAMYDDIAGKYYLSANGENWEAGTSDTAIAAPTTLTLLGNGTNSITTVKMCEVFWYFDDYLSNVELGVAYNGGSGHTFSNGSTWA